MVIAIADRDIIAAIVLFGCASIGLVFAQYYAPPHLRPLAISKRAFDEFRIVVGKLWDKAKTKRATQAQQIRQEWAWQARPCAKCGWQGDFIVREERITIKEKHSHPIGLGGAA